MSAVHMCTAHTGRSEDHLGVSPPTVWGPWIDLSLGSKNLYPVSHLISSPSPTICFETIFLCSPSWLQTPVTHASASPSAGMTDVWPPHANLKELLLVTGWLERTEKVATSPPGIHCPLAGQAL